MVAVRARTARVIDSREPFTFDLEDPSGARDAIHPDVVRTELSAEETAPLRTGPVALGPRDFAVEGH